MIRPASCLYNVPSSEASGGFAIPCPCFYRFSNIAWPRTPRCTPQTRASVWFATKPSQRCLWEQRKQPNKLNKSLLRRSVTSQERNTSRLTARFHRMFGTRMVRARIQMNHHHTYVYTSSVPTSRRYIRWWILLRIIFRTLLNLYFNYGQERKLHIYQQHNCTYFVYYNNYIYSQKWIGV